MRTRIQSIDKMNAKKYSKLWYTPPIYLPLLIFTPEVAHFLCLRHKNYSLHWYSVQLELNELNTTSLIHFNELDPTVRLTYELYRNNLEPRPSSIPHDSDGFLRTIPIGANTIVGYYYGTLVYDNQSIVSSRRPAAYRDCRLAVLVKYIRKWARQLQYKTTFKLSV